MWSDFTLKEYKEFKKNIILISDDNKLLMYLKAERSNIVKFIKSNIITHYVLDLDINFNKMIDSLSNGTFVFRKGILESLDKIPKEYLISWTSLDKNKNKIYIKTTESQYKIFSKRINILIMFMEYIKSKSKNKEKSICIYLVLTPLKKYFPKKDIVISAEHVNSGYTSQDNNGNKLIFIWRHEEFEKVVLHEILHYFDMDCHDINYHNILKDIKIIGMKERYYEAYTDFIAIIYHLIYLSLVTCVKIKSLLTLEYTFIENQAQQLNKYFNLGEWTIVPLNPIIQQTSVFSYYILKYMIFKYMQNNDFSQLEDYKKVLFNILNSGFKITNHIKTKNLRMTLLQLH